MAARFIVVFLVLTIAAAVASSDPFEDVKCFKDLKPKEPKTVFRGNGGMIEMWTGESFPAMKDASIAAGRITIKPGALLMPAYVDIPAIKVVIQGNVDAGVINPMDMNNKENVYKLDKGDVVALPPGVATWWRNNGASDAIVICVGDMKLNLERISEKVFFLAGNKGKEKGGSGSVVRGFSSKILSQAWETSEGVVKKILESQQESGLVMPPKSSKFMSNHLSRDNSGSQSQNQNQSSSAQNQDQNRQSQNPGTGQDQGQSKKNAGFVYHYADATPDYQVNRGGEVRELNSLKMPILKYVGLGAECVRLSKVPPLFPCYDFYLNFQGAMVAPNWFLNGHQFIYVHAGNGKLQVVNSFGDRALDLDLQEGSVAVIPKTFPSTAIAGPNGMDFVSILTTHTPIVSFLAGNNSIYSAMPQDVVSAAFNIDLSITKTLQQSGSTSMGSMMPRAGISAGMAVLGDKRLADSSREMDDHCWIAGATGSRSDRVGNALLVIW
ncbi:glutelin type-B 5 [Selaginella moellendorffii]|uniref:glutelin type-B 5 n=1 Tax=Selaginella moellendorffii TaxID=88036 RepID=UPI000D1CD063|nr:glutelin type-B 5 [Selaginella moellendorffii]|eukprot:XP_024537810.1 glutelin type-B 5 [Selaginella moellendorffii]